MKKPIHFSTATLEDRQQLLTKLLRQEGIELKSEQPLCRRGGSANLLLSSAQQRLWMLHQLEPGSAVYNVPMALRLKGALQVNALEQALERIVARHEALRTTFSHKQGNPVQSVRPAGPLSLPIVDLQPVLAEMREQRLRELMAEEERKPFNLTNGPLLRVTLFRLSPEKHVFLANMHHIVSDGWSINVFLKELAQFYFAAVQEKEVVLPELPIQFSDYATWQQESLEGAAVREQLSFWSNHLADLPEPLELPGAKRRSTTLSHAGAQHEFDLAAEDVSRLRQIAVSARATPFMVFLAAFQVMLFRYTRRSDIVVGTPISGRTRVETEPLIGFFINTLILRTDVTGASSFRDLLERTKEAVLGASANQDVPFERLVEELQPGREVGRTPLFQIMFTFESQTDMPQLPGLSVEREKTETGTAKFDLTLSIMENPDGTSAAFEYATDLFDRETILAMGSHYRTLLREIANNPGCAVAELPMLSPEEQKRILTEWNSTETLFARGKSLHEMVQEQALRTPDAPALLFDDAELSYGELERRSNRLAHILVKKGVSAEERVALCLERSPEIVIAILAVLKAGGAYVPLDPDSPRQRLEWMSEDAVPAAVIVQKKFLHLVPPELAGGVVCLECDSNLIAQEPETPPATVLDERNAAYVIYTSGSTGTPKGVMNEHRSVLNYLCWAQQSCPLNSTDRVLLKTPYTFDVSVPEIFWTLTTGACLVIARPQGHKDPEYMVKLIQRHKITTLRFVPSMLQVFLEAEGVEECASIKRVFASGEALPLAVQKRFLERLPHAELLNHYGPTEAAVEVTQWRCRAEENPIPIGYPGANSRLYVLDERLQPVPMGVPGELFIAGEQVARGYLNRAALTAEKFIPNPFCSVAGERMYSTGDLARLRSDGPIEFLGRLDSQVKLRGFRIELGEIESALVQHPAVLEAVVVLQEKEDGEQYLAAYFTGKDRQAAPDVATLRAYLLEKLPDYMTPAVYVPMKSLPRTSSGKIDRRRLPRPEAPLMETAYAPAHTPAQEMLAGIWSKMLDRPRVGIHDNFFELGGHSLLAIRVVSRIRDSFQVEMPLQTIFAQPTIAHLAQWIEQQRGHTAVDAGPIRPLMEGDSLPLSYNQEGRLLLEWFSEIRGLRQPPFHAVLGLDWSGELDIALLEAAFNEIIRRHQVLRTAFPAVKGADSLELLSQLDPVVRRQGMQQAMLKLMELAPRYFKQRVLNFIHIKLHVKDLGHKTAEEKEAAVERIARQETQSRFDYEKPPLMRVTVLAMAEKWYRIIVTLHHLVTDVWSMEILMKELAEAYHRLGSETENSLPELPIQHVDFAAWQRSRLCGERLSALASYWRKQWMEIGPLDVKELGCRRDGFKERTSAAVGVMLAPELYERAKIFVREQGITAYMLFLGALYILLHAYSGKQKIGVWGNFANRTRTETENMIGWLVNSHLLSTVLDPDASAASLLEEVKSRVLEAHANQEIPYSLLWATALQDLNIEHHTNDQSASPYIMFDFHSRIADFESRGGPQVRPASLPLQPIQLALHFVAGENGNGMEVSAHYDVQMFQPEAVHQLLADYERILEQMISAPERPVSEFCAVVEARSSAAFKG